MIPAGPARSEAARTSMLALELWPPSSRWTSAGPTVSQPPMPRSKLQLPTRLPAGGPSGDVAAAAPAVARARMAWPTRRVAGTLTTAITTSRAAERPTATPVSRRKRGGASWRPHLGGGGPPGPEPLRHPRLGGQRALERRPPGLPAHAVPSQLLPPERGVLLAHLSPVPHGRIIVDPARLVASAGLSHHPPAPMDGVAHRRATVYLHTPGCLRTSE